MRASGGRVQWVCATLVVAGLAAVGCSRQVPEEVNDVNRRLAQAKDECAGVYATDALDRVQEDVDAMNALADSKKYKKARTSAEPLQSDVAALQGDATAARAAAKKAAQSAVDGLATAVKEAADAGAATHAAAEFGTAESALADARAKMKDPCAYREAERVAAGALDGARRARTSALAEKKRLEDEAARLAEENRRREAEEAARRAEEERLRRFPPTYTVARGDSLWKIAGMEKIYGRSLYWPILHDANREAIRNPDLIYPGQTLTVPRGMDASAMDAALRRLWGRY